MRLSTRGRSANITEPVVGRIATTARSDRADSVLLADLRGFSRTALLGYRGLLTTMHHDHVAPQSSGVPLIHSIREADHLLDGDIVVLDRQGGVRTLFRPASTHNTLFLTERCNSNCLMCSQPPKDHDDTKHLLAINEELIRLIPTATSVLGITGGEPTLLRADLFALIALLKDRLPNTHVHLLTNGRLFAWPEFTERFAAVGHPDLVLGIPLYSDAATLHDYIVQAHGAFDQTVTGLYHLARWHVPVELRVVLHKLSIPRLRQLAEYIYRNVPFVVHVALMGLEPTGYTPYHRDKLWVDPYEYQDNLAEAVEYLSLRGMCVSIYNLQRCVLPPSTWAYARQSISDWKNIYLPQCERCTERTSCAGFFQSADKLHSSHLHAL
jgi:His-Xaa-Ser system radical SAM maturase HxsC